MKTARYVALFLTTLFIAIVVVERFPGVLVTTAVPHEWLMFGLFKISLLDDITHGISGILGVIALIVGYRSVVKYLMLIGGYYTLDALFFVVNGAVTSQSFIDNLMLNGPHIIISILVFIALKRSVINIELAETN